MQSRVRPIVAKFLFYTDSAIDVIKARAIYKASGTKYYHLA